MKIRIRFYRERYNMDRDYYTGNYDIYKRFAFDNVDDLRRCWQAILHDHEGETYSAWLGNRSCDELLCGGAFDPDDINIIEEAFRRKCA